MADWKYVNLEYPPELRIGQNLSNFESWYSFNKEKDIFYLEDDKFAEAYTEYLEWIENQSSDRWKSVDGD